MDPDPGWLTADEVGAAEQQSARQQQLPPARQGTSDPRERGQGRGQNRLRRNRNQRKNRNNKNNIPPNDGRSGQERQGYRQPRAKEVNKIDENVRQQNARVSSSARVEVDEGGEETEKLLRDIEPSEQVSGPTLEQPREKPVKHYKGLRPQGPNFEPEVHNSRGEGLMDIQDNKHRSRHNEANLEYFRAKGMRAYSDDDSYVDNTEPKFEDPYEEAQPLKDELLSATAKGKQKARDSPELPAADEATYSGDSSSIGFYVEEDITQAMINSVTQDIGQETQGESSRAAHDRAGIDDGTPHDLDLHNEAPASEIPTLSFCKQLPWPQNQSPLA